MELTLRHLRILKDIAAFSRVKRYRGMLPGKLALCYDQSLIDELLAAGLISRLQASYSCGSETMLLKLSTQGEQLLHDLALPGQADESSCAEDALPVDITPEQRLLLNDIFHFSQISRFGGMMPNTEIDAYAPRDVNTLFAKGYIVRVKSESGSGVGLKGLILSDRGIAALRAF